MGQTPTSLGFWGEENPCLLAQKIIIFYIEALTYFLCSVECWRDYEWEWVQQELDMNVALLLSMALKESLANDQCPLLADFLTCSASSKCVFNELISMFAGM